MKRFVQSLEWTVQTSKKEYLTVMSILFLTYFLILNTPLLFSSGSGRYGYDVESYSISCYICFMIFVNIGGCWIFTNMKTKQQRIAFKMLPASDLEKFLTRVLYVTIGLVAGAFISLCAADVISMLLRFVFTGDYMGSTVLLFFKHLSYVHMNVVDDNINRNLSFMLSIYSIAFWTQSVYVLGGTFFRRKPFIFTSMVQFVVFIFAMSVTFYKGFSVFEYIMLMSATTISLLITCFFFVFAVFNYWLSYCIFKRMQVINNKWINL